MKSLSTSPVSVAFGEYSSGSSDSSVSVVSVEISVVSVSSEIISSVVSSLIIFSVFSVASVASDGSEDGAFFSRQPVIIPDSMRVTHVIVSNFASLFFIDKTSLQLCFMFFIVVVFTFLFNCFGKI